MLCYQSVSQACLLCTVTWLYVSSAVTSLCGSAFSISLVRGLLRPYEITCNKLNLISLSERVLMLDEELRSSFAMKQLVDEVRNERQIRNLFEVNLSDSCVPRAFLRRGHSAVRFYNEMVYSLPPSILATPLVRRLYVNGKETWINHQS